MSTIRLTRGRKPAIFAESPASPDDLLMLGIDEFRPMQGWRSMGPTWPLGQRCPCLPRMEPRRRSSFRPRRGISMRRFLAVLTLVCASAGMMGCHTCDVCDDCGDMYGGYHATEAPCSTCGPHAVVQPKHAVAHPTTASAHSATTR